ncbi:MAG TPA: ferric reductase-like transmembrane domain-containing protein [Solirubrobacteraceae bacterium]|nr:ferric reductase-like transmembrane domain-containing protein [Solirubrobacteraceae bacterium]
MSLAAGATLSPSAYWYLARGTGAVALVLLTASVVIGILGSVRFVAQRWPRFAIDAVHRDVSLLVLVVLAIHIVTSVLDGFAPITLLDGVIPWRSPYRPLWLGLGTLSFDLLVAIAVTSLVRRRLGYRAWRAVHWLAYASWPVAVLHGLGTGSDVKQWWMLALTVVCIMAVLIAVWARIAYVGSDHAGVRAPATALAVITPIGLMIFTLAGPLQRGWAKRAGTPGSLLGVAPSRTPSAPTAPGSTNAIGAPFTASLSGSVRQSAAPGGSVVDLTTRVSGQVRGRFRVRIAGEPIGGGISMTGSQVDLALAGVPSVLEGRIGELRGTEFNARVTDSQGSVVDLHAVLQIDGQSNTVTGTLSGAPG